MTKPVIVTRAGKGDTLSWVEADANFTNLQNATIGVTDGTTSGTLDLNDTLTFTAGSNITLSYNATSKELTINSSGGLVDIVNDTTPQLGGNLDVNGYSIVSASNGNIGITPNGSGNIQLTPSTGKIILGATEWPTTTGTTGQVLTSGGGAGVLTWETPATGTPTQVDFQATPASSDVYFAMTSATGAGAKDLYAPATGSLKYNTGSGIITTDVNLTLNGSNLMVRAGGNIRLYDNDDSNAAILVGPSSLTSNTLFRLPDTNGTSGQVLQTDGSGNTSWINVSTDLTAPGPIGSVTPSTGAFTTLTANTITLDDIRETVFTGGATTGTITPDVANGTIQKITLTGSITLNAFANPVAGQSLTLIITQSASGNLTLTSTMKFANGIKTLSTAANSIDILNIFYDGSVYYASLSRGFA